LKIIKLKIDKVNEEIHIHSNEINNSNGINILLKKKKIKNEIFYNNTINILKENTILKENINININNFQKKKKKKIFTQYSCQY